VLTKELNSIYLQSTGSFGRFQELRHLLIPPTIQLLSIQSIYEIQCATQHGTTKTSNKCDYNRNVGNYVRDFNGGVGEEHNGIHCGTGQVSHQHYGRNISSLFKTPPYNENVHFHFVIYYYTFTPAFSPHDIFIRFDNGSTFALDDAEERNIL
jgi:hypothetical protein